MNRTITMQQALHRANIQVAWRFAHEMTTEQFHELCRVTAESLHEGAQAEDHGALVGRPWDGHL